MGRDCAFVPDEYELSWREVALPRGASLPPGGSWIVLADGGQMSKALVGGLEACGQVCVRLRPAAWFERRSVREYGVRPGEPSDLSRVLHAHAGSNLRGVLHLWGLDPLPSDPEPEMRRSERRGCLTALAALKALARIPGEDLPRLWLITQGAQAVAPAEPESCAALQCGLWGMGRVLALEHPEFWGGLVDLDSKTEWEVQAGAVVRILTQTEGCEDQWALRRGVAYVPRLVRCPVPSTEASCPFSPSANAMYLVTGRTDGAGGQVARWLVERGAAQVVIATDRREAAPATRPPCCERGKPSLVTLDLDDFEQLNSMIATLERKDAPLRGIVHAVGSQSTSMLVQQDSTEFRSLLSARVRSAWNLHRISRERPLDFFVCICSAVSILGTPGSGAAAAADALVDGLAHFRRVQGLPALSLHWGGWRDERGGEEPRMGVAPIEALGWKPVTGSEAVHVLERDLEGGVTRRIVLCVDWDRYARAPFQMSPLVRGLMTNGDWVSSVSAADAEGVRRIVETSAEKRLTSATRYLQRVIAELLELPDASKVSASAGLFELGLDSLTLLALKNRLQAAVERPIPITAAFNHPTVEGFARHLVRDVLKLETTDEAARASVEEPEELDEAFAEIEAMSEEEAELLLADRFEVSDLVE